MIFTQVSIIQKYFGPQYSDPDSLYHDKSKRVYTQLLVLRHTPFDLAGMGPR